MSTVRVLVVDDYEPFRRFICSTLRQRSGLQIVGETSDGLEAVRKAEELQPDLILLDVGLPTLNGIEAARRIRKRSPKSKILFVSQESSTDVVQEALTSGALGYVFKAHAGSELSSAVGAVLEGKQFISGGLPRGHFTTASDSQALEGPGGNGALPSLGPGKTEITRSHEVEFYSDDEAFVVGFTRFIEDALKAGKAIIVASTDSHQKNLLQRLQEHGVNIPAAIEQGRCLFADAAQTLSAFMEKDLPDRAQFFRVADDLIAKATRPAPGKDCPVALCGECGSILWAQGKADAAIEVEKFCHQLARRYEMDVLCGFSLSSFYREEDKQIFQKICSEG
jgi:CheY-like chemotaxis protein